ncbi:Der1 family protein [Entamoeba histolytica HM-1:IMSS-B]|uniref:Derlin n=8 Tax=Entamoeba TaxID=5758 RepID=C4M7Y6_ENTH1|nr:Der1 family protein [Entamoeba nuttalli P19]XP_651477.1 hypothetical protein, conserved [Entamoeba histolytica HM-1:IMSS]EMD43693.1 derlin1, putative [Entamoeba histolytica KU27]EMH76617.1 Der1 family protein [Entamoeba histolytica HM-1:IMSS-B]EMS12052.1 derlin-1, putative [Entamoeba histolytica HM-3:IMSS]ENY64182.1 derlin-1, putative [Entamoeba histolytica HM-1:IMSS-A]GAT97667.1 hypothetical protein conserved [Entamoeba histolytica]|eukprot:XP_008859325.1 Der1 family protein [Entamoeba nuttalli P19]
MQYQESPFSQFFYSIPIVTRVLFFTTLSFSIVGVFYPDLFYLCYFDREQIASGQVWRLFTPFFCQQLGFSFLIHMFMLYNFSKELEEEYFNNDTTDYIFYLLFNCCLLNILSVFVGPLHYYFISLFVYTASRANPNSIVSLSFGITLRRMYLPWALVVLNFILGAPILPQILIILVAHFYYFLRHVIPVHYPTLPRLV